MVMQNAKERRKKGVLKRIESFQSNRIYNQERERERAKRFSFFSATQLRFLSGALFFETSV